MAFSAGEHIQVPSLFFQSVFNINSFRFRAEYLTATIDLTLMIKKKSKPPNSIWIIGL